MGLFFEDYDYRYDGPKPKWRNIGCGVAALLILGPAACGLYSTFSSTTGSVTSAPGRVISRTLETNNILQNYEWFFDTNANYTARQGQITEYKQLLKDETDPAEKQRLRIELSAMRMSCRELATSYNANSAKQNRSLFKSRGLPSELNEGECDA